MLIAEKKFTIPAPQRRVWNLWGRAIFDSLRGMGKMKVIDENNFRCEMSVKAFGFFPMTMYVRGEVIDITPYTSLAVALNISDRWKLINMVQKVAFSAAAEKDDATAMVCQAFVGGLNPLFGWALKGQVRSQVDTIFTGMEAKLRDWT